MLMHSQKQKRVLIFYADTGGGHRSVAIAIRSAMERLTAGSNATTSAPGSAVFSRGEVGADCAGVLPCATSEWRVELHNPIAGGAAPVLKSIFGLYAPVTRYAPGIFSAAYHTTNADPPCRLMSNLLYGHLQRYLCDVLRSVQPDLVVSVNSLFTSSIFRAIKQCNCPAPLFMVVTDLTSIHRSWVVPEVERCFVPTQEAGAEMVLHGMPAEKIWQSGLPVHPDYIALPDERSREGLRQALGLHPELFTVLIVGGGEGVGQIAAIARDLAGSGLPIQLIIVAGRNRSAYRSLEAQREHSAVPQRIYGYTHDLPSLMRASDVIVTKAGSVTIAEALSCGLPIVLSSVIGGQECGNVNFVVDNGVGWLARTSQKVVQVVSHLLSLSEHDLSEMRQRILRLSAPGASFEVAEQILARLELSAAHPAHDTGSWLLPLLRAR